MIKHGFLLRIAAVVHYFKIR
uniref:Extra-large guanine nucleotide-binding protein 3-like n=1 Tax=Rhizophora mucronata TaxID=61149 RepID=A0A2P2J0D8_RHIMU